MKMSAQIPSTTSADLSRLCQLLEQKIAIFKDFVSVTESLQDMIMEHNAEAVELIIARRHNLITAINTIDGEIRRIKGERALHEALHTPGERKRVQFLLKTLENMINKTMRLNQSCETAAEDELNKLRDDLSGLGHSSTWFKGYRNSREPRFLDVKT
jgi:hypothetical protein